MAKHDSTHKSRLTEALILAFVIVVAAMLVVQAWRDVSRTISRHRPSGKQAESMRRITPVNIKEQAPTGARPRSLSE